MGVEERSASVRGPAPRRRGSRSGCTCPARDARGVAGDVEVAHTFKVEMRIRIRLCKPSRLS